jgi:hypothetical protein
MRVIELIEVSKRYRYLECVTHSGRRIGLNCAVAPIVTKVKRSALLKETSVMCYREISFMRYISIKAPFVRI